MDTPWCDNFRYLSACLDSCPVLFKSQVFYKKDF